MNKSSTVTYSGTWSDETFKVEFTATGNYWYQPCVMYFADGTGQPEDWDVEDIEVTIKSIKNKATGITVTELFPTEIEDIKEKIADACYEGEYEMNFPEDPYDYYEEEEND
jgi:hypothetical protein